MLPATRVAGWVTIGRLRWWIVFAAGCGRVGFAERAPDAPCDPVWTDIRPITELASSQTSYGGQITPDGLRLYFDSNRGGDEELYVAERPDRDSPFAPPVHLAELASPDFDGDATVTGDELELLFDRISMNGAQMMRSVRTTSAATWAAPQPIGVDGVGPALSFDGLTLFYNTGLDAVGEGQLYVTTRTTRGDPFGPGVPVVATQAMPRHGYASLSPDGLLLLFEAETGPGGVLELWQLTRASAADAFDTPARIAELASGTDDADPSITADGRELFFASSRGGGKPQLYVASRGCR